MRSPALLQAVLYQVTSGDEMIWISKWNESSRGRIPIFTSFYNWCLQIKNSIPYLAPKKDIIKVLGKQ